MHIQDGEQNNLHIRDRKEKNRYIHTPYGNKAVIYINNMVNKTEIGKRIINILDMASKREI